VSEAEALATLNGFVAALRGIGLRMDIARTGMFYEALEVLPAPGLRAVFLAGRTTLCGTPEDVARYDACFAKFFFGSDFAPAEILPD